MYSPFIYVYSRFNVIEVVMSSPSSSSTTSSSSNVKQTLPTQVKNPVALRLYKILGTSFDDIATREALQTLSDLYVQNNSPEEKPPDPTQEGANSDESGIKKRPAFFNIVSGELAARARKNLRRDMENKLAQGSQQFLKTLGEVDDVSFSRIHTLKLLIAIRRK